MQADDLTEHHVVVLADANVLIVTDTYHDGDVGYVVAGGHSHPMAEVCRLLPYTPGRYPLIHATCPDNSDEITAMYVELSDEPVVSTRELLAGLVMADFDADGRLVGLEILRD